jgi:hypothetical protein
LYPQWPTRSARNFLRVFGHKLPSQSRQVYHPEQWLCHYPHSTRALSHSPSLNRRSFFDDVFCDDPLLIHLKGNM